MKILLVDDDHIVRRTLDLLLTHAKLPHDVAESGDQALAQCAAEAYELVVSDIDMPGMDGVELARRLKKLYPDMHLFAFSGSSGDGLAVEAYRVFDRVFRKPEQARDVVSAIREVMAQREMQKV
jgi:CheY-like chemotaxis protein